MDSRKSQTSTATPAQPGDFPDWFNRTPGCPAMDDFTRDRRIQWLLLIIVWAILLVIVGTSLLYLRRVVVLSEQGRLAEQARIVEINIQHQLEAANAALFAVVRDLPNLEADPGSLELSKTLKTLSNAMAGVRTLQVLDSAGNVLGSNRPELVGRNFFGREYVQAALSKPRADVLYLTDPYKTVLNVYSMNLSRASLTPEGGLHRIVTATLDPEFFEALLSSVRYEDDFFVSLLSGSGRLVLALPQNSELLGFELDTPGSLFRQHKASCELATVLEGRSFSDGELVWLAQRTIECKTFNMTNPLVVAVSRDTAKALEAWRSWVLAGALLWLTSGVAASIFLIVNQRNQARIRAVLAEKEAMRQQAEEEHRLLAFYDPLTRLPNRRLLMDRLQQLQAAGLRHGRCSVLLFIDLDGFKQVNDIHGHEAGDQLLQEVAARLNASVRAEDTVSRLGGDEFVVLLAELGAETEAAIRQAEIIADKLVVVLSREYRLGDVCCRCSASIGITLFGYREEVAEEILRRADGAMYEAKKAGRNASRVADSPRCDDEPEIALGPRAQKSD